MMAPELSSRRFNAFCEHTRGKAVETAETFAAVCTGLKPGVNDKRGSHCKGAGFAEH
jgi:hypothetical protein